MITCQRCGAMTSSTILSMFNQETICLNCKEREFKHPDYQKALDADIAAIKAGNYHFEGIGKPHDL